MSSASARIAPGPPARAARRWARRLIPLALLAMTLGVMAYAVVGRTRGHPQTTKSVRAHGTTPVVFNHHYPPDPAPVERPAVYGGSPVVPKTNVIRTAVSVTSMQGLANQLPTGLIRSLGGNRWLVTGPVALEAPASLSITGADVLLAPHGYLLGRRGASITLTRTTVEAVGPAGKKPVTEPTRSRGFVAATEGARLVLTHDTLIDLGHLGSLTYGVSFSQVGPGSQMVGCTVTGAYFGVYLTQSQNVRVVGNRFVNSLVYGIDPHTDSSGILIQGNTVTGSGVHGIILAAGVHDTRVIGNTVTTSRDHGIVLYENAHDNTVTNNRISNTFDGIVVTDSSGNVLTGNVVDPVARFGLRMSGASHDNVVRGNTFDHALVGVYVYAGPSGNRLRDNRFSSDREDVRVRVDAKGNLVRPVPPRSELHSP